MLGQDHTFSASSELLARLCGVSLSDKQVEHLCHHYGEALANEESLDSPSSHQAHKEDLHYVMVDGSYILSRESSWTETKVGRLFAGRANFEVSAKRSIIEDCDYVAHIGSHTDFTAKMQPYLAPLHDLVFIADGASWIWKWVSTSYPTAVQILDFYHAFEKIAQWGGLFYKDKEQHRFWCESCKSLLLSDQVGEVIESLHHLLCRGEVEEKKQALLTYLENHAHRMRYQTFLEKGYLIGSGAIESAQRTVVQHRLKRSGQRWTLKGGQQILNLRTKQLSKQWSNVTNLVRRAA